MTEYGDTKPATLEPAATSVARSRRSTSAPMSASNMPANCTGPMFGSSSTRIPASGPVLIARDRSRELEDPLRVLAEELGPDVVAERHVGQLGEDAVVGEAGGEVAATR